MCLCLLARVLLVELDQIVVWQHVCSHAAFESVAVHGPVCRPRSRHAQGAQDLLAGEVDDMIGQGVGPTLRCTGVAAEATTSDLHAP